MFRIDTPGATSDGKFTGGNPTAGVPATQVSGDWLTAVQEEIIATILAGGGTLNKANNGQLLAAIVALIAGGGVAVTAAAVTVADAGEYFATDDVEAALEQLAAKIYAGVLNASQLRRTIVDLTATTNHIDASHAENVLELTNAAAMSYVIDPDSTLDLDVGTAITLFQGGAGQVTVSPGAGVTLKYDGVNFQAKTLAKDDCVVIIKVAANTWRLSGMLAGA